MKQPSMSLTAPPLAAQAADRKVSRSDLLTNRRLVLASNRGPVEYRLDAEGIPQPYRGPGGLVSALGALGDQSKVQWICTAMTEADRAAVRLPYLARPSFLPPHLEVDFVSVPEEALDRHYNVISNPILWFIQHYLWNAAYGPHFDETVREAWNEGYVAVNRAFVETLVPYLRVQPGEKQPFLLLHDYQLYLVAGLTRARCPDAIISHFVHIPWPSPDYWRLLPVEQRCAIVESLVNADVVGFQTDHFARNFLLTCQECLPGVEVSLDDRLVIVGSHRCHVRTYPVSVDVARLRRLASSPTAETYRSRLLEVVGGRRAIVRVDRLDPSKNVLRGFEAYRLLLERRPDLRGHIVFLAFLVPSRTAIGAYRRYHERTLAIVDEINQRFGTDDWQPIHLFYENNVVQALAGMRVADVVLVNSVMDGMNLVAKESVVVNDRDAVLVLSESAGAFRQLGELAVRVSPADVEGTADALEGALEMPRHERALRATCLRQIVERYDLQWWIDSQLADLAEIEAGRRTNDQLVASPAL